MAIRYILPILCTLLVTACGSGVGLDENSRAVRVASDLPAPDSPELAINLSNYRIGPLDEIVVSVFGAPELDREGAVDAAGNFSVPLVGTVAAAGKTPAEFASSVEEKLNGRYLRDPQVSVNIKAAKSQMVTIDGAVQQPGVYPVVGQMTLQQAIATAKGAKEEANINRVIVFRTVSGQRMAAMFNLKDIRSGRYVDPQVYGNDIVVVGEDATRRFLKDAAIAFPLARFIPVVL